MDASTISADTFSLVSLWTNADWVIKGVMVGLALASLWSWAVIIDKAVRFGALNSPGQHLRGQAVGSGRPLEEVAAEAGADNPVQPLPRLLVIGPGASGARRARKGPLDRDPGQSADVSASTACSTA
jgi:biopolymer transport protein TolQ